MDELEFWMKIALAKDEEGRYINGPEQEYACNMINKLRGVSETEDIEYELIEPKQLTNG